MFTIPTGTSSRRLRRTAAAVCAALTLAGARPARAEEAPPTTSGPSAASERGSPRGAARAVEAAVMLRVAPESSRTDLTLYVQDGVVPLLGALDRVHTPFAPVCHAPCSFEAPFGLRAYAASAGGGTVRPLDRPLALEPGDTLTLHYRSRAWLRFSGFVLLVAGVGAGSALFALGSARESTALNVTGGAVSGASLGLGLLIANLPDRVSGSLGPR